MLKVCKVIPGTTGRFEDGSIFFDSHLLQNSVHRFGLFLVVLPLINPVIQFCSVGKKTLFGMGQSVLLLKLGVMSILCDQEEIDAFTTMAGSFCRPWSTACSFPDCLPEGTRINPKCLHPGCSRRVQTLFRWVRRKNPESKDPF